MTTATESKDTGGAVRAVDANTLKGWLERGLENPVRGWHAPCFGRREPAPRLVFAGKMWQGVVAKFTLSTDFA